MSKFYGTLVSDKGEITRAGHRYMKASAQSHDGSATVEIGESNGVMMLTLRVQSGSGTGGDTVLYCKLDDLKDGGKATIVDGKVEIDTEVVKRRRDALKVLGRKVKGRK